MNLRKRIAAMGAATVMAVSMVGLEASAYGTADFSNKTAGEKYTCITKTQNYSIEYCYGVWVTSIAKVEGHNKGVPRFLVKVNSLDHSDYVDVNETKKLYTFDSSMCRGKDTYYGYVKNKIYNKKNNRCECKVSGQFRFM